MPLSTTSDSSPTPVMDHDDEELNTDSLKKNQKKNVNTVKKVKNMSDGALSKQRFTIDKIKKDNDLLRETITNITRNVNTSESVALGKKINKLNDIIYNITLKIQEEKRKVENLEEHFKDTSNRIEEARIERSGVNVSKESNRLVEKQIKVLENRLDKALVKFNESLTENKVLREQIENLRQERVVFDSIYKKMEKELQEKKKEMAKIIEVSNSAYEERGQALEEQKQVKEEHQSEIEKIEEERNQLDRLLKEAEKVTEKLQQRELERREREIQEAADIDRKRLLRSSFSPSGVNKTRTTDSNEKRKQYEDRFSKIEEATGKGIDELIDHFSQSEDQNFSLFTYVNELNSEIEKLEENIVEIEDEIKKFKGEGVNSESQRKKVLSDIQEKINETNSKTDLYQRKYENSLKTLDVISRGIETIFNKLGCDPSSISDMLGTTGVTESNMMIYLGFIEQRTNEIVQMSITSKKGEGKKDDHAVSGPKHPVGFTDALSIEPPSTANDGLSDDDDDEEDRPFTREELMQKAKKSTLSKKPKKKAK